MLSIIKIQSNRGQLLRRYVSPCRKLVLFSILYCERYQRFLVAVLSYQRFLVAVLSLKPFYLPSFVFTQNLMANRNDGLGRVHLFLCSFLSVVMLVYHVVLFEFYHTAAVWWRHHSYNCMINLATRLVWWELGRFSFSGGVGCVIWNFLMTRLHWEILLFLCFYFLNERTSQ